jgi:hypothetical protein
MALWASVLLVLVSCAAAADPVIVGLQARQCNSLGNRNLGEAPTDRGPALPRNLTATYIKRCSVASADGNVILSGDQNLQNSPAACCASCKSKADCNVWNYCAKPEGTAWLPGAGWEQHRQWQAWAVFWRLTPSQVTATHCPPGNCMQAATTTVAISNAGSGRTGTCGRALACAPRAPTGSQATLLHT